MKFGYMITIYTRQARMIVYIKEDRSLVNKFEKILAKQLTSNCINEYHIQFGYYDLCHFKGFYIQH